MARVSASGEQGEGDGQHDGQDDAGRDRDDEDRVLALDEDVTGQTEEWQADDDEDAEGVDAQADQDHDATDVGHDQDGSPRLSALAWLMIDPAPTRTAPLPSSRDERTLRPRPLPAHPTPD